MSKKIWVWDLETLDLFTATFVDRDSDDTRVFVYSNTKNEMPEMFEFLSTEVDGLIGYNSLNFDAQVLEYMYRYKETGDYFRVDNTAPHFDGYDYTKWDMVDYVANKYNRIVMYRGNLYHASLDYFGNNLENGRLFQTFFFNTEY